MVCTFSSACGDRARSRFDDRYARRQLDLLAGKSAVPLDRLTGVADQIIRPDAGQLQLREAIEPMTRDAVEHHLQTAETDSTDWLLSQTPPRPNEGSGRNRGNDRVWLVRQPTFTRRPGPTVQNKPVVNTGLDPTHLPSITPVIRQHRPGVPSVRDRG